MVVLIGSKNSKRTKYFLKAADKLNIPVHVIAWDDVFAGFNYGSLEGAVVKIDPPSYKITDLSIMQETLLIYQDILKRMSSCRCCFLNTPEAILNVLDKRAAKKELARHGIPVTNMVLDNVNSAGELLDFMKCNKEYSLFIKPVNYSGAAGVLALRLNPVTGRMKLYTSCRLSEGKLYNTKKLFAIDNSTEIINIIDKLAGKDNRNSMPGLIAEKWHPKDSFNGMSYDLRVVLQFGNVRHIVVRQSSGPVTNLHLNNNALDFKELNLPGSIEDDIREICKRAAGIFKGLDVSGIDVMLDRGSRKPRIIEINGQGDLIYQDIFSENKIYTEQVNMLSGKA
ncbi:MAG: hypothetical protein HFH68_04895 [Lachnospiraceae bacterium]|nr:hypothetical protein [Lachnospiraceae bacterium]